MAKPKFYLHGEINQKQFKKFSKWVDEYLVDDETEEVVIELYSHGGDADAALAFYGKIRTLVELKLQVTILVYGECNSAATLILAAGSKRRMHREAWAMVHQGTTSYTGDLEKVRKEFGREATLEDQWNRLLQLRTTTSQRDWERLSRNSTYLSAVECLGNGLIDEVF